MWKNMGLTGKIIVAMVLGIILGLFINYSGLNTEGSFVSDYVTNGLFAIIGKLFVNSLKMLVVPLVLIAGFAASVIFACLVVSVPRPFLSI